MDSESANETAPPDTMGAIILDFSPKCTRNMGAGASAASMKAANYEANKPLDASDITEFEQAKHEIARLRQVYHFYRYNNL